MNIKTGYFAKTDRYVQEGYIPVSIARTMPKHLYCRKEPYFAPSYELFTDESLSLEEYTKKYLSSIKTEEVCKILEKYEALCRKENKVGIIFLCWEKDENECHRSILADYLNGELGLSVSELETGEKEYGYTR